MLATYHTGRYATLCIENQSCHEMQLLVAKAHVVTCAGVGERNFISAAPDMVVGGDHILRNRIVNFTSNTLVQFAFLSRLRGQPHLLMKFRQTLSCMNEYVCLSQKRVSTVTIN